MEFINVYIAPWVLPKQVFPIHCVWKPEKDLSRIVVIIPQSYKLHETLNFVDYAFDEAKNIVTIDLARALSNKKIIM